MDKIGKRAMELHRKARGKIRIESKVPVRNREDLSLAYTPGVAEASLAIARDPEQVYSLTSKWNMVAIVTDGSAVLGLGDIGPEAALPVMEGKAVLLRKFAGVDGFPICLRTKNVNEIVETVERISPSFGAINLEDISSPRCFDVERRLKERLRIPVMHDDQHGTAVVVLAALKNSLKLAGKKISGIKIVINGAGAAGTAVTKMLMRAGAKNIILCDKKGIVNDESFADNYRKELISQTNPYGIRGSPAHALKHADVFIGLSVPKIVTSDMVRAMNEKAIVFAMANPVPEIQPNEAKKAGAFIIGTGRSDYPNQINNALGYPGIFRGALDARARSINQEMLLAAADALANVIPEKKLRPDYIIPSPFDKKVVKNIAEAVGDAVRRTGVAKN